VTQLNSSENKFSVLKSLFFVTVHNVPLDYGLKCYVPGNFFFPSNAFGISWLNKVD
jgi:hypothetical protein